MGLIFRNGSGNYEGESFNDSTTLLENLRDWLQLAGWTIRDDFISASQLLVMQGNAVDNNDVCFIEFRIADQTGVLNGKILEIRGDIDGSGNDFSEKYPFNFIENSTNIIYLTADDDSFAIFIESNDGQFNNGHFGFLERLDPNSDTFGWMVGRIDWRVLNASWAKSYFNNTVWRIVGDDFWYPDYTSNSVARNSVPYQGLHDRYTTNFKFVYSSNDYWNQGNPSFEAPNSHNIAYYWFHGALNPVTNLPVLGEMYYLEGRGSENNYGSIGQGQELPSPLYYRGAVKHCVIGMASLTVKTQVIDKQGQRYLSVGNKGQQGMRIE